MRDTPRDGRDSQELKPCNDLDLEPLKSIYRDAILGPDSDI